MKDRGKAKSSMHSHKHRVLLRLISFRESPVTDIPTQGERMARVKLPLVEDYAAFKLYDA